MLPQQQRDDYNEIDIMRLSAFAAIAWKNAGP
jgi:hypothetical protein